MRDDNLGNTAARNRTRWSKAATAFVAALFISGSTAPAYNLAGHYESLRLIIETDFANSLVAFNPNERALIAYCGQLPDRSTQLSATEVYLHAVLHPNVWNWFSWAAFDQVPNEDYQSMVAVQELLHSLTGGDSAAMRAVALATARYLIKSANRNRGANGAAAPVTLCALGFALHLYGDTFAHRVLPWFDAPTSEALYPTGRGHAFDMHYPDDLQCNKVRKSRLTGDTSCDFDPPGERLMAWTTYLSVTSKLLGGADSTGTALDLGTTTVGGCTGLPERLIQKVCADVQGIVSQTGKGVTNPDDADDLAVAVLETDLKSYLDAAGRQVSTLVPMPKHGDVSDCDANLAGAISVLGINWTVRSRDSGPESRCAQTWKAYAMVAAAYLQQCEQRADGSSPGASPDLGGSLAVCTKAHRPVAEDGALKRLASGNRSDPISLYRYACSVYRYAQSRECPG